MSHDEMALEANQQCIGKRVVAVGLVEAKSGDKYIRWTFEDGAYIEWHTSLWQAANRAESG